MKKILLTYCFILLSGIILSSFAQSLEIVTRLQSPDGVKLFSNNIYNVYLINRSSQSHTVFNPLKIDRAWRTHKTICTQFVNGRADTSSWFVEFTNQRYRKGNEVTLASGDSLLVGHAQIKIGGPGVYKFVVTHEQLKEKLAPEVLQAYGEGISKFTFFKVTSDTVIIPVSIKPIISDNLPLTYEKLANSDKVNEAGSKIIEYGQYTIPDVLPQAWADKCYKLTVRSQDKEYFHLIPLLKNVRWISFQLMPGDTIPACISQLEKLLYVSVQLLPKVKGTAPIHIDALKDLPNLRFLSLNGTNVEKFPEWIGNYKDLQHLYLYGTSFKEFGPAIGNFSNLETLYLVASNGKQIPVEILKLKKLKDLTLMSCMAIPAGIAGAFPQLENLKIENYNSTEIPDFSGCTAVTFLFTAFPMKEYPTGISSMQRLKRLEINGKFGNAAFPDLSACSSLEEIWLTDNDLVTFPEKIGEMKNLKKLVLNTPILETISENIGQCEGLNSLIIAKSKIQTIPATLTQCRNLKSFSMQQAGLTAFPAVLFDLSLEYLNLGWNKITIIPQEIARLTSLQTLSVAGNQLTALPDELLSLPALQTVVFHANQISKESVALYQKKYPKLKL